MKVLIFDASGQMGKALMREWRGDDVTGLGSRDVDIRDAAAVRGIVSRMVSRITNIHITRSQAGYIIASPVAH